MNIKSPTDGVVRQDRVVASEVKGQEQTHTSAILQATTICS